MLRILFTPIVLNYVFFLLTVSQSHAEIIKDSELGFTLKLSSEFVKRRI